MKTRTLTALLVAGSVTAGAVAAGAAALAAGQSRDAQRRAQLARLFPDADRFSPKEGSPPHFKVYADERGSDEPRIVGYAFLTTDLEPLERGYDGPIQILVGMDTVGVLTGIVVGTHHEPYGYFSIDLPGYAAQFEAKSIRDRFRLGRDVDAVATATLTVGSATRAVKNSARRIARAFLRPPGASPVTRRPPGDRPSSPAGPAGRPTEPLAARSVLRRGVLALLLAGAVALPVGAATSTAPVAASIEPAATSTEPAAASSFAAAQPADEAAAGDFWDFEDEEEVETWGVLLRDQGTDLALFAAFATLALVSFHRKSVPLKYVTLVAAVAYLGFYKSQLISVVNIYSAATGNLPVFRYSLAWYLFAGFTVVSTILWGRLYCGRVCAYGALTQLLDRVVPARFRLEVPPWLEHRAARIKYFLLGATLIYFLATSDIAAYRYVEPFWMFTLRSTPALWTALALLLVATVFVRNLYCRFLCPVGAALGLLSTLTIFRIKRWSECNTCKICEKACEWGAIQGPRIDMTECVRCDDCERLYADTAKCPHWIILRRIGG